MKFSFMAGWRDLSFCEPVIPFGNALMDLACLLNVEVVKARQVMHETRARLAGGLHQRACHAIQCDELVDALLPDLVRLAH